MSSNICGKVVNSTQQVVMFKTQGSACSSDVHRYHYSVYTVCHALLNAQDIARLLTKKSGVLLHILLVDSMQYPLHPIIARLYSMIYYL